MRVRSEILRWGLLVALALCVVLMHHVPGEHDQPHPPAAAAHHVAPVEHDPGPAAPDHGLLLHLCLAVLTGFVVLLLPLLHRALRAAHERGDHLVTAARDLFRPPTPVPRRLAALCVLQC
ncbi:hypothetical protein [Saccharopolyspora thermophila]|uniref:Uncharacterized protein n=1 Tax=Saccharopolyspora thermophila TaxID=89367 RepID=A0ABN1BRD4_9PSEU